ncbi:putative polysaccharide biosynthesis protein [Paenisporosarcina cavernae]|uniref:Polysaccharide biosynthesis protein n=1 Tax=Paenisporosarcina cavernae TaxID=2320858 RepID=A0A385YST2_9BACL|nr:oligosaccharide flippase family protein [Paenisporosarcina cavernae]AYC29726.1 polysaccharide biosynthesis protein [Paenisporosarcina cavernae]
MTSFVKGTIVLMFTVFLSKLFGFVFRMQFVKFAGEEAIGYYSTIYPTFIFFLSFVQIGLPIAIAKLTAEHLAKKEHSLVSALTKKTWTLFGLSCVVLLPILYFLTPFIATVLLKNEALASILIIALITVPFSTVASIIKGYLQGMNKIDVTAWAGLLEQVVRIVLVSFVLPVVLNPGDPLSSAEYAMGITLIAEIISLSYLFFHYKMNAVKKSVKVQYPTRRILQIGIPSSGSRLFGSFTWFLEPIVFIHALGLAGITAVAASELYGTISGVLIPLLLFPAFIPYALSVALIPAVSDAKAREKKSLLQKRIHLSLRVSAVSGCLAATVFYLHGEHIVEVFFHLSSMGYYLHLLTPIFFFYYIQSPLHAILQALHEARAAFYNSVFGGIGKLFLLFYLASRPGLEEFGAILAIGFGVLLTTFLHVATLRTRKETGVGYFFFFWTYTIFLLTIFIRPVIWPLGELPWIADSSVTLLLAILMLLLSRQIKLTDFQVGWELFKKNLPSTEK